MGQKRNLSLRKFIVRTVLIITVIVVLLILVASPVTKYLVEKYDVEYTGREITIGRAFVNPIAGYFSLRNLTLYEADIDTAFFSVGRFIANFRS